MKSSWRFRFGSTIRPLTLAAMPLAIGLAKNGIPWPEPMRSKMSLSSSGGIAEPSAKCSQ